MVLVILEEVSVMTKSFQYLLCMVAMIFLVGCCERRCGVKLQKEAVPVNLQEKLIKMKEQMGDKGYK